MRSGTRTIGCVESPFVSCEGQKFGRDDQPTEGDSTHRDWDRSCWTFRDSGHEHISVLSPLRRNSTHDPINSRLDATDPSASSSAARGSRHDTRMSRRDWSMAQPVQRVTLERGRRRYKSRYKTWPDQPETPDVPSLLLGTAKAHFGMAKTP